MGESKKIGLAKFKVSSESAQKGKGSMINSVI